MVTNKEENCIPVSVGVLTWNSERTLARCLESLKDFCEVIVADGGSSDRTLEIAKEYGCKIISQSEQGKPIEDFALERNRMLDTASYDWFFYLDSDEVMTPELAEAMRDAATRKEPLVYEVQYRMCSSDLSVRYRTVKNYYQPRFFNKQLGVRFIKPMHERIDYDRDSIPVGRIDSPWLVPLDVNLKFDFYKQKITYRLARLVAAIEFNGFADFMHRGIFLPLKEIMKFILKAIYLSVRYGPQNVVPFRYQLYRIYSEILKMKFFTKEFFK